MSPSSIMSCYQELRTQVRNVRPVKKVAVLLNISLTRELPPKALVSRMQYKTIEKAGLSYKHLVDNTLVPNASDPTIKLWAIEEASFRCKYLVKRYAAIKEQRRMRSLERLEGASLASCWREQLTNHVLALPALTCINIALSLSHSSFSLRSHTTTTTALGRRPHRE